MSVRAIGKGRKERVASLTRQTIAVLRVWMRYTADEPESPLFPSRHGGPLTRDAIERRLAKHVATARRDCPPTLGAKRVSMHVLRHTAAMTLLNAGIDTSTIALWLGHEQERTTHIYLHADLALKQRTLDRITPPNGHPGRYRAHATPCSPSSKVYSSPALPLPAASERTTSIRAVRSRFVPSGRPTPELGDVRFNGGKQECAAGAWDDRRSAGMHG
jgi:Phage integrase family